MKNKKLVGILMGIIVVLIIAIAVVLGISVLGKKEKTKDKNEETKTQQNKEEISEEKKEIDSLIFVKDGEFFYHNLTDSVNMQLSNNNDIVVDEEGDYEEAIYVLKSLMQMGPDGKTLFYPDKQEANDEKAALFYREIDNKNAEPTLVAEGIQSYTISKNMDAVVCHCYDTQTFETPLYYYDFSSAKKIANDVKEYHASKDGKKVLYLDNQGGLYLYADGTNQKVEPAVSSICYVGEDLSDFYYLKENGNLCRYAETEGPVVIASKVQQVVKVYETGEIYFVRDNSIRDSFMNYIENDAPEKAELCRELSAKTFVKEQYELYLYDGESEILLEEHLVAPNEESYPGTIMNYVDVNDNKPLLVYQAFNAEKMEKPKLSQIYAYEAESLVDAAFYGATDYCVTMGGQVMKIFQENPCNVIFNEEGTAICYMDNHGTLEEPSADLYKMEIEDDVLKQPELYDTNVIPEECYFLGENKLGYYKNKNIDNSQFFALADLYCNQELIAPAMLMGMYRYFPVSKKFLYYADWDFGNACGTLCEYENGVYNDCANAVHEMGETAGGKMYYLKDYNGDFGLGDLYILEDDGEKIIETGVLSVFAVSD